MTHFTLVRLNAHDADQVEQVAHLLVAAFAHQPDTWDTIEAAREEVREALEDDKINVVALDGDGRVIGWVGGFHAYARVWELHPIGVHPAARERGIGAALLRAFEADVKARGGLVVTLGTDDVLAQTSLADTDLYPDVWTHLRGIRNLNRHPYAFYQKQGYVITGVIPDANGWGKPDILMCKRLDA